PQDPRLAPQPRRSRAHPAAAGLVRAQQRGLRERASRAIGLLPLAQGQTAAGWKQERGDSLGTSLANGHQFSQMESRITTLIAPRGRAHSRLNSIADITVLLIFA